jgi:hypothetical protein
MSFLPPVEAAPPEPFEQGGHLEPPALAGLAGEMIAPTAGRQFDRGILPLAAEF